MNKVIKILGWLSLALILLALALIGYQFMTRDTTNERVAQEIRENPEGERAARTMLLTLADGTMYPVNYLREGNTVYMGIDGRWWRQFVGQGQPVSMFIKRETLVGHAVAVLDDQPAIDDVFSRLRPKVPWWLPDWLNGKLVVISLTEAAPLPAEID